MTFSRKRMAVAIGSAMGLGIAGSANALTAVDLSASPIVPLKFASEMGSAITAFGGNGIKVKWTTLSNYAVNAANPFYIKIALKSGAKFKSAPGVFCSAKTAAGSAGGVRTLTLTNGGGAGSTSGTWQLASGYTLTGGTCFVSAKSATISSHVDQTISAVQEYKNGLDNATLAKVGTFITFTKAMTSKVTVGSTAVQLDVSQAAKTFVVGKNLTTGLAQLGNLTYSANANVMTNTGNAYSAAVIMKSAHITVSGATIAGAKTDYGTSAVAIVSGGAGAGICSAAAGKRITAKAATTATNSLTFKFSTNVGKLSAGVGICIRAKTTGGATKNDGATYITFSGTGQTNYTPSTGVSGASLKTVTKNGTTRRVFNIPAVDNTSDAGYVRITNGSTVAAKIYVTLTDQDGATIGTASSALNGGVAVAAGATLVLDAATLKSAVGATTNWTGRARATFVGETDSMEVMGLIRNSSTGILTNMSPVAPQ